MDTIEETPIADISATYLTDDQFNKLYPMHPSKYTKHVTLVSIVILYKYLYQQEEMETEPYITSIEDLDKFLEEMEKEVTAPVTTQKSNKVC